MRALLLPLLLSACNTEEWVPYSLEDEGSLCLSGEADGEGTVQVVADTCLSSSCSRSAVSSCTATEEGRVIAVHASFSWEELEGDKVECTADCGILMATCTVGPLAAGAYSLEMGATSADAEIPAEDCQPW